MPLLSCDPVLVSGEAICSLFLTEGHICIRFAMHERAPYNLWQYTKKYNAAGHIRSIEQFLDMARDKLDARYSILFQRDALREGSFRDQVAYMTSPPVQDELDGIMESEATSFDADRGINLTKRSETRQGKKYPLWAECLGITL